MRQVSTSRLAQPKVGAGSEDGRRSCSPCAATPAVRAHRTDSVRLVKRERTQDRASNALLPGSWRSGEDAEPGLRYERFVMSIPAQSAPAGPDAGPRLPRPDASSTYTLSPRLGSHGTCREMAARGKAA